jgi:cytochrome P450
MTAIEQTDVYWDPYDVDLNLDPYPLFKRLRDEAPLYYNEAHDFYAVSRAADVERAFADPKRLISGRSSILEFIKAGIEFPPGMFIFEDPPQHTMHRGLLARAFTPRRMAGIEPEVREFCKRCLDRLADRDEFDFVQEYGDLVAARSIGMILGIPEPDQMAVKGEMRGRKSEAGQPYAADPGDVTRFDGEMFADYIEWRVDHPSDDLMTALLNVEFEDDHGVSRRLTRGEILTQVNLLAGAGNDTTAKLIGWTGKLLADHPDQRRQIEDDLSLAPAAVEELLRFQPPGMQNARFAVEDVEFEGGVLPANSAVVTIMASANRDERRFADPDVFDIHRRPSGIMTFAFGIHFCMGAALARLQGRVALEEVLKRFPEWSVDEGRAVLRPTPSTRGFDALPVIVERRA